MRTIPKRPSRYHRIEIPRGIDRADIVRDDEDRHEWFRLFNGVATRCGWMAFDWVAGVEHREPPAELDSEGWGLTAFDPSHPT